MGAGNYQHQHRRNQYMQPNTINLQRTSQPIYFPFPQSMILQRQVSQPLIRQQPSQQSQPQVIQNEICISNAKIVDGHLVFMINTLTAAQVQFHVRCIERVNPVTMVTIGIHTFKQNQILDLEKAVQQYEFTSINQLDQSIYINQENTNNQICWALIIKIMNQHMQMFYYYEIEHRELKQKHQKYQTAQGAYEVNEIYGINESGLVEGTNKVQMREDSNENCTICVSEIVNTIIMPCRHMCICTDCAQLINEKKNKYDQQRQLPQQQRQNIANPNTCPVCRKEIESFIRLKKIS